MRFVACLVAFFVMFLSSCASSNLGSGIKWEEGRNRFIAGSTRFRAEVNTYGDLAEPLDGVRVHYSGINEVDTDPTEDHVLGYNVFGVSLEEFDATEISVYHRSDGHDGELFGGVRYSDLVCNDVFRLVWLDFGINDEAAFANSRLAFKAGEFQLEPTFEILRSWEDDVTPAFAELNVYAPNWLGSNFIRPYLGGEVRFDDIGEGSSRSTNLNVGIAASF